MPRSNYKPAKPKQVLIVALDRSEATRLRGVLEGLGYRGVTGNVTEALGLARGLRLSLALVDAAAAGPDLDHLADQLHRAAVPVVVLHPEDTPPPAVTGATAYLKKPWRTADLMQTLYRFAGAAV
jgi:CheY-like chemotaxis protein